MKKILIGLVALTLVLSAGQTFASATAATPQCYTFNNELYYKQDVLFGYNQDIAFNPANDVKNLQQILISKEGATISDKAGAFREGTAAAVIAFQTKYNLVKTGVVSLDTKTQLNQLYGCISASKITLDTQKKDVNVTQGSSVQIKWTASKIPASATLKIALVNTSSSTISVSATTTIQTGVASTTLTLPSTLAIGTYKVQLSITNGASTEGKGLINLVASNPSISISSPVSGSSFIPGKDVSIGWTVGGLVNKVDVSVVNAAGTSSVTLKNNIAVVSGQLNSLTWKIPKTFAFDTYKILFKGVDASSPISASTTISVIADSTLVPTKPISVSATKGAVCGGQVSLTWATTTGATSYNIYRLSGGTYVTVKTGATSTNFTDTVVPGSKAYYKVSAVNANGESVLSADTSTVSSAVCTVLAITAAPAKPVVTTSSVCGGNTTVSWSPVTGAATYNLYRSTAANVAATLVKSSISDTNVNDNPGQGNFYYYVSAVNSVGESARSVADAAKGSSACLTPSITKLSPLPGIIGTQETINGASFSVTGNTVVLGGISIPNLISVDGKTILFTVPSQVSLGSQQISVGNVNGTSSASSLTIVSSTVTSVPPKPVVTATTGSACGGQISVSWSTSTSATSYNIYSSNSSSASTFRLVKSNSTSTSYSDLASPGATVYYKVSGVNAVGESVVSAVDSAKASAVCTLPAITAAPAKPVVTTSSVCGGNVNVAWTAVTGATSYNVYRSTATNVAATLAKSAVVGTSTVDKPGSLLGNFYYYISAVNSVGESARSTVGYGKASGLCVNSSSTTI